MAGELTHYFYFFSLASIIFIFLLLWRKDGLFSPFIWFTIHMGLYYVVAPWFEFKFSDYRFTSLTLFASFISIFFTLIWFAIFSRLQVFQRIASVTHRLALNIEANEKSIKKRVIFFSLLGLSLFLVSIYVIYGTSIGDVFSNPLGYRKFMTKGVISFYYSLEVKIIYDVFFLYLAYRAQQKLKMITTPIIIYSLFLLVLSFGFGSRGILISIIFQIAVLYELFYKRISLLTLSLITAVLIPLVVLYSEYRMLGLQVSGSDLSGVMNRVTNSDANFEWLARAVSSRLDAMFNLDVYLRALDSDQIRIEPLSSVWNSLQQLVPRNLWPDKPYYFSAEMTRVLLPEVFYNEATYDFTGIAEFVHNFSWEGIAFFSLMPASILAVLHQSYKQGNKFIVYALVYLPFIGLPISIINNGFLNSGNIIFLPVPFAMATLNYNIFARHRRIVIRGQT